MVMSHLNLTRKQEEVKEKRKMEVYKKPGVYVKEVDISTYTPPKKWRRMRKIAKIFTK